MPPTAAPNRQRRARRWTAVLAVPLAAALLAAGTASAGDGGELVWLGEAGGRAEERWTTDPGVRPWRDAAGRPAAFRHGLPVAFDDRAGGQAGSRTVVVAEPAGVVPRSVRFSHRAGRYVLDAAGRGVAGLTTITVDGGGELEVRAANRYAGTTELRQGLLAVGHDAALGHSTLLVRGGTLRAAGDRRLANPLRFRHHPARSGARPGVPEAAGATGRGAGLGPVAATVVGDHDLTAAGGVELNPARPTTLRVEGPGVVRLLGVHDPADGQGMLVKRGPGMLELGGDGSYRGGTVVAEGTLVAGTPGGTATGRGPVTVRSDAVLRGAGRLAGALTVERGGVLAPGAAPRDLATLTARGPLALRRGAVLDLEVGRRGHDRLRVAGGVLLDRPELRVTLTPGPPARRVPLTIVDNAGDGPVAGTFRGLPEGTTFAVRAEDGRPAWFRIGYRGGDGNDVVLTPRPRPAPPPLAPTPLPAPAPAPGPVAPPATVGSTPATAPGRVAPPAPAGGATRGAAPRPRGEGNRPPVLRGPVRASVAVGAELRLAFTAGDPDQPGARLRYGLTADAPAGMRIDPRSGLLRWAPRAGQRPGAYEFAVWVLDGGAPPLAGAVTVTVTVAPASAAAARPPTPAVPAPRLPGGCHGQRG
jgi:autotransporter-associated beta strand protein